MIEKRRFGRTGHMSTVTLFGAAALKNVSQGDADRALELLLRYGVNHIIVRPWLIRQPAKRSARVRIPAIFAGGAFARCASEAASGKTARRSADSACPTVP